MPELGFQDSRSGLGFSRRVRDVSPDSVIYTGDSNFSIFSSASGSVDRCSFASDAHDQESSVSDVSQVLLQLRFLSFITFHCLCLVLFLAFTCIFCYSCSVQNKCRQISASLSLAHALEKAKAIVQFSSCISSHFWIMKMEKMLLRRKNEQFLCNEEIRKNLTSIGLVFFF